MRYFIDTEFDDTGKAIELISIALVREDGEARYFVSAEFDPDKCNDWVKANVLPILGDTPRLPRSAIAASIRRFIGDISLDKPEFWGYFADYDWIGFCQLWGRMLDLPKGFPLFCMDIRQWSKQLGIDIKVAVPPLPGSHNALVDAQWNRAAHDHLLATVTATALELKQLHALLPTDAEREDLLQFVLSDGENRSRAARDYLDRLIAEDPRNFPDLTPAVKKST